ncbi:MAG: hypothetical protein PHY08_12605, partial [Candidatus Cloacimonetes bacterium]|nr:hypothetical protein [Candidatus Cloacimonadota bacterium]
MKENKSLSDKYENIAKHLNLIDFKKLWLGFKPYRFALYNDTEVFFDGHKFPKTDQFIGNTTIEYEGEQIAIWEVNNKDNDIDLLTVKIVHEMFHAYQVSQKESRFPNELEAVIKYNYSATNLNIKLAENNLLTELVKAFDQSKFDLFLSYRAYRKSINPYSFHYESSIEVIEGTALYVELQALYQLNSEKAAIYLEKIVKGIIDPQNFIPVRIISYDTGAIILKILQDNKINFDELIFKGQSTYMDQLLNITPKKKAPLVIDVFSNILIEDEKKLDYVIEKSTISKPIVEGSYKLFACNIYDARYHKGYLLSKHFIAYVEDENSVFMNGNFLAKISEEFQISA